MSPTGPPPGDVGACDVRVVDSRSLADVYVADRDLDVVAADARVVEVALDRVEAHLAAGSPDPDRIRRRWPTSSCRGSPPTGSATPVRARRRVDERPRGRLPVGQEDSVVRRPRRRAVVDAEPLPVDHGPVEDASSFLLQLLPLSFVTAQPIPPGLRGPRSRRSLDRRLPRRCRRRRQARIRVEARRADDVELVAAVDRAVDE